MHRGLPGLKVRRGSVGKLFAVADGLCNNMQLAFGIYLPPLARLALAASISIQLQAQQIVQRGMD
jgi:hypothetical protein